MRSPSGSFSSPFSGPIRPKISTMPRPKTEAAAYLDIYKLVNEKKRLQQELSLLDEKRDRLQQRLAIIEAEVVQLEHNAHHLRDQNGSSGSANTGIPFPTSAPSAPQLPITPPSPPDSFDTLFLEY
jgi:hypothetical protein